MIRVEPEPIDSIIYFFLITALIGGFLVLLGKYGSHIDNGRINQALQLEKVCDRCRDGRTREK